MLRLVLLTAAALLVSWGLPILHVMLFEGVEFEPASPKKIHLTQVDMTTYAPDGSVRNRVIGAKARLGMKGSNDVDIEPVKAEIYKAGALEATLTGEKGRKLHPAGEGERLEVEGNVLADAAGGRQLMGSVLHYLMKDEQLIAPARATVLTTMGNLSGDRLEARLGLEQVTATGNVVLERWLAPSQPGGQRQKLEVRGRVAFFDLKAQFHRIEGDVVATRPGTRLLCDTLEIHEADERLVAHGSAARPAEANEDSLKILATKLNYKLDDRVLIAQGSNPRPRVVYTDPKGDVQQLDSISVVVDAGEGERWMRGKGACDFRTFTKTARGLAEDVRITSDEVEAFHETGRATFEKNVKAKGQQGKAEAQHGIYYRKSKRVYLSGNATAWELDARGQPTREVRGDRIQYDTTTGNAVVLGGVRGTLNEGL